MVKQKLDKVYLAMTSEQLRSQLDVIGSRPEQRVKSTGNIKLRWVKLRDLIIDEIYRRENAGRIK